jgi:putative hemolysin
LTWFLGLLALLAFFAGTEFPLLSVSEHKIQAYLRQKKMWAKSLAYLRKKWEALLVTNLIGTTLATVWASSVAALLAISLADITIYSHDTVLIVVPTITTLIILFIWEIVPKIIGITIPERIALLVAPIYRSIFILFRPISWLVEIIIAGLSRLSGKNLEIHTKEVSEEELDAFIDMSHAGGAVEEDEKRQIKNLLNLSDMTADSVMTPRVNVEFLSLDMTVDEVCDFMMESSHSRLPVCGDSTDDVDSVMTFREAFHLQREWHGSAHLSSLDLEKIMKVSLTQALDDLFEKFQRSRRHIALVLDEHGGTAGVVTMEDVLEEVFWDIKDEKDREEIYMKKWKDGSIEAIGSVLIDDILEEYDMTPEMIDLPQEYMSETLSYVLMAEEEWFPNVGDIVSFWDTTRLILQVLSVDDNVIERVECRRK